MGQSGHLIVGRPIRITPQDFERELETASSCVVAEATRRAVSSLFLPGRRKDCAGRGDSTECSKIQEVLLAFGCLLSVLPGVSAALTFLRFVPSNSLPVPWHRGVGDLPLVPVYWVQGAPDYYEIYQIIFLSVWNWGLEVVFSVSWSPGFT